VLSKDYTEENLAKLYELEIERDKLEQLADEQLAKGEGLSSPELVQQNAVVLSRINLSDLAEMADAMNQPEKKPRRTQKSPKK
jgi:hypothetical protein